MSKFTGLGMALTVDDSSGAGVIISEDVASVTQNTTNGEQDVTGLSQSAIERLSLLEDTDLTINGSGFPSSTTRAVFTNRANERTVVIQYPDLVEFTFEGRVYSYNLVRGQDGGVTWTANIKQADGAVGVWS
jgi:hypothetical protein